MADNPGSSSSDVSSRCSSDTEMMVKSRRTKELKHGKVNARHKHKKSKKGHHHDNRQKIKLNVSKGSAHTVRRPRHSLSSSSSGLSSERDSLRSDESSSEQDFQFRKANHSKPSTKHKRKKSKLSSKDSKPSTRSNQLRAVFREHFAKLMLVSDPEPLAAQLYSDSLISCATLDKVITMPISQQHKNLHLLLDLDRRIRADPEKLFAFIDVIRGDPSLEEIAEQISGMSTFRSFRASQYIKPYVFPLE